MKRHVAYLKYVLIHKWYVLKYGIELGAPLWRLIIHDWTKFLPSEWIPYAYTFYDKDGNTQFELHPDFRKAWNFHQKRNKHHWQYWIVLRDEGDLHPIEIPRKFILEMIADWKGAGKAITGDENIKKWYMSTKIKRTLHGKTQEKVEEIIYG